MQTACCRYSSWRGAVPQAVLPGPFAPQSTCPTPFLRPLPAAATPPGGSCAGQPKHIYVVGCGHSGTSILKRTISNLPGLLCLEIESEIFIHTNKTKPAKTEAILASLAAWDAQAAAVGFEGWVEKTPRHVLHLQRLFNLDPSARVVFIVRDGRDVAASIERRGYTFEQGMTRWAGRAVGCGGIDGELGGLGGWLAG